MSPTLGAIPEATDAGKRAPSTRVTPGRARRSPNPGRARRRADPGRYLCSVTAWPAAAVALARANAQAASPVPAAIPAHCLHAIGAASVASRARREWQWLGVRRDCARSPDRRPLGLLPCTNCSSAVFTAETRDRRSASCEVANTPPPWITAIARSQNWRGAPPGRAENCYPVLVLGCETPSSFESAASVRSPRGDSASRHAASVRSRMAIARPPRGGTPRRAEDVSSA